MSDRVIYLDHAATTPMTEEAMQVYLQSARRFPGNPSSLHGEGRRAKEELERARGEIAAMMGCAPWHVIFTSGGSEGDSLAIRAAVMQAQRTGGAILSGAMEHDAVRRPLEDYHRSGGKVTLLAPAKNGVISPHSLISALSRPVAFVSLMAVNNETGIIQPWREMAAICAAQGIPFHTDAVQAVGRLDMRIPSEGPFLLTASAHKFGGPRGVGFLIARDAELSPMILGGLQEGGRRAGTEALPAICAMTCALKQWQEGREARTAHLIALHDRLAQGLSRIPGCLLTAERGSAVAGHLHASLPGLDGEAILWQMDARGIAISTGSACHALAGSGESGVLAAMGMEEDAIRGAIRISASWSNTAQEIDEALSVLDDICARMRKSMRGGSK